MAQDWQTAEERDQTLAPTTPKECADWLWQLGIELDKETRELASLRRRYVELQKTHRLAYATAFLEAEGTVEDRKNIAMRKTAQERMDLDMQEQLVEVSREKLRTLRDRSEIARAINANLKTELSTIAGP